MARLPVITDEEAPAELRLVFSAAREMLGWVSNCTRTVAHSPWLARWWIPFVVALQRESGGLLDAQTKELAILRTSILNGCEF